MRGTLAIQRASARDTGDHPQAGTRTLAIRVGGVGYVLAVADGAGGTSGGSAAAQMAIAMVREAAPTVVRRDATGWFRLLRAIDERIAEDPDAGETTVVALAVTRRRVVGASVGDSAAWWALPDGRFDLTERQSARPRLGNGAAVPTAFTLPRPSTGTLILATHGLYRFVDDDRILDAALISENVDSAADALIALPLGPSGRRYDDVALIVFRPEATVGVREIIGRVWRGRR